MKRIVVPLIALFVVIAAASPFVWRFMSENLIEASPRELTLAADGALHRAVEVRLQRQGALDATAIATAGLTAHVVAESEGAAVIVVQAPVTLGPGS